MSCFDCFNRGEQGITVSDVALNGDQVAEFLLKRMLEKGKECCGISYTVSACCIIKHMLASTQDVHYCSVTFQSCGHDEPNAYST